MSTTLSDKPMFSNRELISLVIPLIFDSILAIAAGLIDSAMVSSAGVAAVSGVSLVASLSLLFTVTFNAIAAGGVVVTSQYLGSGDTEKARMSANQLVYMALTVSMLLTAFLLFFYGDILKLVFGSIEEDVYNNSKTYLFWILLGYPFLAVGNCCTALLRSMRKNHISVILTSSFNVLNVIGNAVLIYGLKLGVAGAAISTTISRIVFAVGGLVILHNKELPVHFSKLWKMRFDLDILKRVCIIGGGNGIENGFFQLGRLLVARLVSSLGTVMIAANSISTTINNIGWVIICAFSTALLPIAGQCMGAGRPDEAERITKKMLAFATVTTVVIFSAIFLLRNQLVRIYSLTPEELEVMAHFTGVGALLTIVGFYPHSAIPLATFRAAGDTKYSLVLTTSTMFISRVGIAYLLSGYFGLGLYGIWIGMAADFGSRSVINTIHLKRGKWKQKKVI